MVYWMILYLNFWVRKNEKKLIIDEWIDIYFFINSRTINNSINNLKQSIIIRKQFFNEKIFNIKNENWFIF